MSTTGLPRHPNKMVGVIRVTDEMRRAHQLARGPERMKLADVARRLGKSRHTIARWLETVEEAEADARHRKAI